MKSVPEHFPDWIRRVEVAKRGGSLTQVVADDAATLVYLAAQNVITPHIWLSRIDEPKQARPADHRPRPEPGRRLRRRSAPRRATPATGCATPASCPFAMVTGSRGVHVVCPLRRGPGFGDVHKYARSIAEEMVADDPKRLTLEWKRDERGARIFVDVNRINYAQHAVAPYGVRARPRAPVAMPIEWDELSDPKLKPDRWTIRNAADRLASQGDAWKGIGRRARKLPYLNSYS